MFDGKMIISLFESGVFFQKDLPVDKWPHDQLIFMMISANLLGLFGSCSISKENPVANVAASVAVPLVISTVGSTSLLACAGAAAAGYLAGEVAGRVSGWFGFFSGNSNDDSYEEIQDLDSDSEVSSDSDLETGASPRR